MVATATGQWRVQVGKGKSRYTDKYTFPAGQASKAVLYYNSLNTHSGHKKRLVSPEGKIIGRILT